MIADRKHPDLLDAYLNECGFSAAEVEKYYVESNLRRKHLIDCYRMKRNVRLIGVALLVFSIVAPMFGGPLVVSIPILVYAVALIATGSLTVYQP